MVRDIHGLQRFRDRQFARNECHLVVTLSRFSFRFNDIGTGFVTLPARQRIFDQILSVFPDKTFHLCGQHRIFLTGHFGLVLCGNSGLSRYDLHIAIVDRKDRIDVFIVIAEILRFKIHEIVSAFLSGNGKIPVDNNFF